MAAEVAGGGASGWRRSGAMERAAAEGPGGSATEGAGVRETREEAAEEAEAARAGAASGGEGEEATGPRRWGARCRGEVAGWGGGVSSAYASMAEEGREEEVAVGPTCH